VQGAKKKADGGVGVILGNAVRIEKGNTLGGGVEILPIE